MSQLGNFVWSIADQLRGPYKPHEYGDVILPMTILRRMDCVLEPSKADVLAKATTITNPEQLDIVVRKQYGLNFYNTSTYDLKSLLQDPDNLVSNLVDYIHKFSANGRRHLRPLRVRQRSSPRSLSGTGCCWSCNVRRRRPAPRRAVECGRWVTCSRS